MINFTVFYFSKSLPVDAEDCHETPMEVEVSEVETAAVVSVEECSSAVSTRSESSNMKQSKARYLITFD